MEIERMGRDEEYCFLTIKQFCLKYPWVTEAMLRQLIFNAATNGFTMVIQRLGRKILLNERRFFDWMRKQNQTVA